MFETSVPLRRLVFAAPHCKGARARAASRSHAEAEVRPPRARARARGRSVRPCAGITSQEQYSSSIV